MATVESNVSLADQVDLATHAAWARAFSPSSRADQLNDDLIAGRSVTGVLFAVVCLGTLLMAFTVWMCL